MIHDWGGVETPGTGLCKIPLAACLDSSADLAVVSMLPLVTSVSVTPSGGCHTILETLGLKDGMAASWRRLPYHPWGLMSQGSCSTISYLLCLISVEKNLPANTADTGLIPRLKRPPGEGNDNPLQYSCLGNPTDRRAWWATVHGVTKE